MEKDTTAHDILIIDVRRGRTIIVIVGVKFDGHLDTSSPRARSRRKMDPERLDQLKYY